MPRYRARLITALLVVVAASCGGSPSLATSLGGESMLDVTIPGTSGGDISEGPGEKITKLFEVTGDWTQVSIDLARIVQDEGWTIVSLNCVGTGNDVIARKLVDGQWLLLESGAGERGAGVIVSRAPHQGPPEQLTVMGRCPDALVRAVD